MKLNQISLALGVISVVAVSGCGGDSSSSSSGSTSTYSVKAIDGYLKGAVVWLDLNKDFVLDNNEPNTISGDGGVANLDVTGVANPEQYPVVVRAIPYDDTTGEGTLDLTEGPVTTPFVMSAPAGETDITPLSTLVHVILEQTTTDDSTEEEIQAAKDAAVAEVAGDLGIEEDAVLGDFFEEGNPDAAFAAEVIVSEEVLPQSSESLGEAADGTEGNTLLEDAERTASAVKELNESAEPDYDNIDLDADTDGDGVSDVIDAFPNDETEQYDLDGDSIGDNADLDDDGDERNDDVDLFPTDPAEWADADSDNIGDNADLDDDNDGVADLVDQYPNDDTRAGDTDEDGVDDLDDEFPDDPTRAGDSDGDTVDDLDDQYPDDDTRAGDSDGDGVDDLADEFPDDNTRAGDADGDGVDGLVDAFPLDPTESVDTDDDGIGNNADEDDDNDGVRDEFDTAPLDDQAGNTDNAKVVSYLSQQSVSYIFDGDIEDGYIDLETLAIANGVATIASVAEVNQFGEFEFDASEDDDLVLSNSGWVKLDGQYTLDFSDPANIEAYATNFDFVSYSLDADLTHLKDTNISQYILSEEIWDEVLSDQGVFSEGAYEVSASLTPDYDIYYLYPENKPWIHRGDNGQSDGANATTLEELVVATSVGQQVSTGAVVGVHIAGDGNVGGVVELVEGMVANYYTMDWTTQDPMTGDTYATLVGSGTWSESPVPGTELIEFPVPNSVLTEWGALWYEDTATGVFSVYDGHVRRGSVEKEGVMLEDDDLVIVSEDAKDEIVAVVDLPLGECYTGNVESGASLDTFQAAITACGGSEPITSEMISGNTFERYEDRTGDTRQYTFTSGGTVHVGRNGLFEFNAQWLIEGEYLRVNYDGGEIWHWALLGTDGNQWSVKHLDQSDGRTFIWSEIYESSDNAVCSITEMDTGATQQDFEDAIADYETCKGETLSISEERVAGLLMTRFRSNGEIRTYDFSSDGSYEVDFYRNGSAHYTDSWRIDDGKIITLFTPDEVTDQLVILGESDGMLQVGTFNATDQEMWIGTYYDYDNKMVDVCRTGDTEWDDVNDLPLTTASFDEYLTAVDSCKEDSGTKAYFSAEYFDRADRQVEFITDDESYLINSDGTGSYIDSSGAEPETFALTWTIDSENDLLVTTITFGELTAIDYISIVDTDGIELSFKVLSKANEVGWPGIGPDDEGDLWSGMFTSNYIRVE
jgi:hypothetical protein